MSKFTASSRILVTGANGHVAQHVVQQLLARPLESRPKVVATIRSEHSATGLRSVFGEQIADGSLQLVFMGDITQPGAFDDTVQGCTHIAHIASPLVVGAEDVENEVLKPAINGTTGILQSALKVSTLQAVVVTSSFASCFDAMYDKRPGYTYTSKNWNPITYEEVADPSFTTDKYPNTYAGFITYMASKKLAERAAWDFYEREKPEWSLATVNPTYIGGPNVLPLAKGPASLSFSQGLIWNVATSNREDKLPEVDFPYWVDVRDVAKAHLLALSTPAATGNRFVLAACKLSYSMMADVIREEFGRDVSAHKQDLDIFDIESVNCAEVLGIKEWIPFDKMVCDTIKQIQE